MRLRSLITIILLSITTFSLSAQTVPVVYSLKGIAIDSATNKPAGYMTINLQNEAKQSIRTLVTKTDGSFSFEKLAGGKYILSLVSIGFRPKTIPVDLTDNTKQAIDLGNIFISPQNNQLAAVSITGSKPVIKQETDRISYDLEADPESKANTVMEMMRKVPMLSVDGDDNILLKGNSNYKIFINGKPSSMMERNAKDILKTMPASSIKNIEVIFSPSSKYDAEGIGGIINIVTTRKIDNGYNGSFNVNERFPVGGPGAGGTFTFKQGKFGISSQGGINFSNSPLATSANSRITTGSAATSLSQSFSKESDNHNGYAGTNLSFEIDSLNLISGQFNYNGSGLTGSSNQTSKLNNGSGLIQGYDLSGNNTSHGKGMDGALNYQLGFKSNKARLLTFSYQNIWYENNQFNSIDVSNPFSYAFPDYQQTNKGSSSEQTAQIDYVHPVKKLTIEGGLKEIIRNNKSDFRYSAFNSGNGKFETDPSRTNNFDNHQNIYAVYNSYSYNLKNWGFRTGMRIEQTIVYADFISASSHVDQNYFNFIPSIGISRKFKDMSMLTLNYNQRLQRPGINQLNPFVDRSNPTIESSGNPNLRPALTNRIDMGYNRSKKGTISISLQYMFFNNLIGPVYAYDSTTNITRSTFENTGKVKLLGGNIFISQPFTKKLNVTFNTDIRYGWINVFVNNAPVKNNGLMMYGNISAGYRFDNGMRFNASMTTMSRNISSPQGKVNGYVGTSFSLNKEIVKDKLSFSATANNPFTKYRTSSDKSIGPDFTQVNDSRNYYRGFSTSLNYRFGKLKESIKKNNRGIKNDDLGGGL